MSLLERIAAGDSAAVGECLDLYGGLVWTIARRLCPTPEDTEDAVQEIFLDVWKSADRFDPSKASEKTFVAMIARRRAVDRLRRAGRRPQTTPLTGPTEHIADDRHVAIERSAEASQAAAYLDELRPAQKQVIEMSIYQGLTHTEIAKATGLAVGTVKSHIWRGLNRLREILAEVEARAAEERAT